MDKEFSTSHPDHSSDGDFVGVPANLENLCARLDGLESKVSKLSAENDQLKGQVSKLSAENDQLKEQISKLNIENSKLNSFNAKLSAENIRLSAENNELRKDLKKSQATVRKLSDELARAWRSKPSSEKGNSGEGSNSGNDDDGSGNQKNDSQRSSFSPKSFKEVYYELIQSKSSSLDWERKSRQRHMTHQQYWQSLSSDPRLIPPREELMGSNLAKVSKEERKLCFDRDEKKQIFGTYKGLHSSFDITKRFDLNISLKELNLKHETLRNESQTTISDKAFSVRKSGQFLVPNSQITVQTLVNLISLHCEFMIPLRRLEIMLTPPIFSATNIGRWISCAAGRMLPIYLSFADQLGEKCHYLRIDDTNTHVLQLLKQIREGKLKADSQMNDDEWERFFQDVQSDADKGHKPDLITPTTKRLGRISQYASSKEAKTKVNLTLVSGLIDEHDWRSMICFKRTHCGGAGNLVSRILEPFLKDNKDALRKIIIQSDCSDQNNIDKYLRPYCEVDQAGCSDHARRPFKRYASEDENLAYYFLIQFFHLYNLEREIKCGPLTEERILGIRKKGFTYWEDLFEISKTVMDGKIVEKINHRIHDPTSNLYKGCQYISNNYKALTFYLTNAKVGQTNGFVERKLRPEKLFINSSKFSFSELGSITKDIHQTIISTSLAAGVDPNQYYCWILNIPEQSIKENPQNYSPYVFALQQDNLSQNVHSNQGQIDDISNQIQ